LKEKYKKRYTRLNRKSKPETVEEKVDEIIKKQETRKSLLLYQTIIERVKTRYHNTKSFEERRKISSLICSMKLLTKQLLGKYARKIFGYSQRRIEGENRERRKPLKTTRIKLIVVSFLEIDDNSRVKAGKKSTITRKGRKKKANQTVV